MEYLEKKELIEVLQRIATSLEHIESKLDEKETLNVDDLIESSLSRIHSIHRTEDFE